MNTEQLKNTLKEKIEDIDRELPYFHEPMNLGWAGGKKAAFQDVLRWLNERT